MHAAARIAAPGPLEEYRIVVGLGQLEQGKERKAAVFLRNEDGIGGGRLLVRRPKCLLAMVDSAPGEHSGQTKQRETGHLLQLQV